MNRHCYFREGDIIKWLKKYVQAKTYIKHYKYHLSQERRIENIKHFEIADRIYQQFIILKHSLSENDFKCIIDYLKEPSIDTESKIILNKIIIENWNKIVLNSSDNKLQEIDILKLGKMLKYKRELSGYYRVEAAKILGVSEHTLRSYEDGVRTIKIDLFYKIMQLYQVGDISDFLFKCKK